MSMIRANYRMSWFESTSYKEVSMKTVLSFAFAFAATHAFALEDSPCDTKQKNAASFELAQKIGAPVQSVEIIGFEFGSWTEAVGNNTGSDKVIVSVLNPANGLDVKSTFQVFAKQIGATADCNIRKVVEL